MVLPSKMAEFYSRFPLDKEEYDFQSELTLDSDDVF